MANKTAFSMNVDDYTLSNRQMSRKSRPFIACCVFTVVICIQGIVSYPTQVYPYPLHVKDCFDAPHSISLTDTVSDHPIIVAWSRQLCGMAWIERNKISTSVNFTWFDSDAFASDKECLGDIVKITDISWKEPIPTSVEIASNELGQFVMVWPEQLFNPTAVAIRFVVLSPFNTQTVCVFGIANNSWQSEFTIVKKPVVAAHDQYFALAWIDNRSGRDEVYLRRYSWTGQPIDAGDWCLSELLKIETVSELDMAITQDGTLGITWCESGWIRDTHRKTTLYSQRLKACWLPIEFNSPDLRNGDISQMMSLKKEITVIGVSESDANMTSPRIVGNTNSEFVIVWQECSTDGGDIVLSQFDKNGVFLADKIRVDQAGDQIAASCNPDVSLLPHGLCQVVWDDVAFGGSIFARIWDTQNRCFLTTEFTVVHADSENQSVKKPRVASNQWGYGLTTWIASSDEATQGYFMLNQINHGEIVPAVGGIQSLSWDDPFQLMASGSQESIMKLTTAPMTHWLLRNPVREVFVTYGFNENSFQSSASTRRLEKKIAKGWRNLRRCWNSDKLYNVQMDECGIQSTALQAEPLESSAGHGGSS